MTSTLTTSNLVSVIYIRNIRHTLSDDTNDDPLWPWPSDLHQVHCLYSSSTVNWHQHWPLVTLTLWSIPGTLLPSTWHWHWPCKSGWPPPGSTVLHRHALFHYALVPVFRQSWLTEFSACKWYIKIIYSYTYLIPACLYVHIFSNATFLYRSKPLYSHLNDFRNYYVRSDVTKRGLLKKPFWFHCSYCFEETSSHM